MTDFDTCTCPERPIKCPACCLASWNGHRCSHPGDHVRIYRRLPEPRKPEPLPQVEAIREQLSNEEKTA